MAEDLIEVDAGKIIERLLEIVGELERRVKLTNELVVLQQEAIRTLGTAVDGHQRILEALTEETVAQIPSAPKTILQ